MRHPVHYRWLSVNLIFLYEIIVACALYFALLKNQLPAGVVGMSVAFIIGVSKDFAVWNLATYPALQISDILMVCIRRLCELETMMVSVERIQQYLRVVSEVKDSLLLKSYSFDVYILDFRPTGIGAAMMGNQARKLRRVCEIWYVQFFMRGAIVHSLFRNHHRMARLERNHSYQYPTPRRALKKWKCCSPLL